MGGEQRGRANHLQRFAERQFAFVDQVVNALDADKGRVTFVAVVNILVCADRMQQAHTADAEQHLLFESVFPITAV